MHAHDADGPPGMLTELHEALDVIPADEPRNYLRQSLQLLVPLLEQLLQRLQTMEARLEALESRESRGEVWAGLDGLSQSPCSGPSIMIR